MDDLSDLHWPLRKPTILPKNRRNVCESENRRFWKNGWPKSKTNTGNGFLGVDYIYLDTSFVPIKVGPPGGAGGRFPLPRGGWGKIFFQNRKIFWKSCLRTQKATSRLLNCARAPPLYLWGPSAPSPFEIHNADYILIENGHTYWSRLDKGTGTADSTRFLAPPWTQILPKQITLLIKKSNSFLNLN